MSTALITGASVGIGRELARLFAADKHDLILTARNQEQLNSLADELRQKHGVRADVFAFDLARPESAQRLFDQIAAAGLVVDFLVNNAGFGTHGLFHVSDQQSQLDMLQVNVVALTHLARLFLPGMVQRGRGKVMNIASTAAFQPGPYMAVYYASKAYVLSLSEALHSELQGTGVTVTAVCPGPTKTEFQIRAKLQDTPLFKNNTMTAEKVARLAYRGTMRGQSVIITGLRNRVLARLSRLAPRKLVIASVKKLQRRRI